MNRMLFCNGMLVLLAGYRVPQVVLLTEQADARQNGVYEVLLDGSLGRVGDPSRRAERVRLGAGWRVSDFTDEHGFCPVERCVDQATTDGMSDMLRRAIVNSAMGQAAIHPVAS